MRVGFLPAPFPLLLALASTVGLPGSVRGQSVPGDEDSVALRGQVLRAGDSAPVEGATVEIEGHPPTVTDRLGGFAFPAVERGDHTLRISHVAYATAVERLATAGSPVTVHLHQAAIPLDPIVVSLESTIRRIETRRRAYGFRSFAMDLGEGRSPGWHRDVVGQVAARAGVPLRPCGRDAFGARSCWATRGRLKRVRVVLDGMRIPDGLALLGTMDQNEIVRVELYPTDGCVRAYTRDYVRLAGARPGLITPFMAPC